MKTVNFIFPHQLFYNHKIQNGSDPIYLIEEYLFFREFNFHKGKIAYHRASMKSFEAQLQKKGRQVVYIEALDKKSDVRKLISSLSVEGVQKIRFVNPTDFWLEKRIHETSNKFGIELEEFENPLFINDRQELKHFFKSEKKSFFQTTFYKQERVKRQILLEGNDQPLGGKWTYDVDNRKKFPKKNPIPSHYVPELDTHWEEAVDYVENHFGGNLGALSDQPLFPHTLKGARDSLKHFFDYRFHNFGAYEDAIVKEVSYLHHSVLTPMMNIGLLPPLEVLDAALEYGAKYDVPLNSLEGFVRQIMGWREFIRGMYEVKGVQSRTRNYWNFKRKIPGSFYDGSTGIEPIDTTIKKILKTGYCHHIERLMILGNFMLLCEFDPDEVYRWFMELFIDAYDWVMVPNVYGMSQFADGGLFATKPYISGSNYIFKMSNYKKEPWHKIWDGLFWRFMDVHRDFFLSNPRLGMLVKMYDKMDPEKQKAHHTNADSFLEKL